MVQGTCLFCNLIILTLLTLQTEPLLNLYQEQWLRGTLVFDVILSGDISKKWRIGFLNFPLQCYLCVNKPVVSEYNKSDRHEKCTHFWK